MRDCLNETKTAAISHLVQSSHDQLRTVVELSVKVNELLSSLLGISDVMTGMSDVTGQVAQLQGCSLSFDVGKDNGRTGLGGSMEKSLKATTAQINCNGT